MLILITSVIKLKGRGVFYEDLTNHQLTFDSSHTSITVNISIIVNLTDTVLETEREIVVSLSCVGEPNVILDPENTTITVFEIRGEGKP